MWASVMGHTETVKVLCKAKADIHHKGKVGDKFCKCCFSLWGAASQTSPNTKLQGDKAAVDYARDFKRDEVVDFLEGWANRKEAPQVFISVPNCPALQSVYRCFHS